MNNDINNQETIDLLQLFVIAKQNLLLFITICFVCVAGAFCVTKFFIKEEFTAEAKMIIVQKSDTTTSQQNYTYSDVQLSQKLASTYNEIIMS
ncbi:MAG: Wzz/FepE/Etk N-terminal domain-containing protein, partial [Erysipelotrichaceae bacterium]|nr:Wzz/FepE/Etk N-terminal domain-containing protein [Erysipelotrichaceae bacterium]